MTEASLELQSVFHPGGSVDGSPQNRKNPSPTAFAFKSVIRCCAAAAKQEDKIMSTVATATKAEPQAIPSKISARASLLKEQLLGVTPEISFERAELVTESYKETEGLPIILRRAKALEKILANMMV